MNLSLVYCGETITLAPDRELVLGRDADFNLDENPYLHRRFLRLVRSESFWWIENVGSHSAATIGDVHGLVQSWLAPGARLPLVFERTVVWFTAGPTTYEFELRLAEATFRPTPTAEATTGDTTIERASLTPTQRLMVVALCEPVLRRDALGPSAIPANATVAQRLGWSIRRFNRTLDEVCLRLSEAGVQGLHGGPDSLATNRRARLVEYAVWSRMVTADDLRSLPSL